MKKRIISLILTAAILVTFAIPIYADKTVQTASFYRVNMRQSIGTEEYDVPVEVMVYPDVNELYIKADDLAMLALYEYNLTEESCAFADKKDGHLVYFVFNSMKALVYQTDYRLVYELPYSAKYVDGVAWVPMDFGFQILNIHYLINDEGVGCCLPFDTLLTLVNRILDGQYAFDCAEELGKSDLEMFVLQESAFAITLLQGLLHMEGSCWGALLTCPLTGTYFYDAMMAEKVCELYLFPTTEEMELIYNSLEENTSRVTQFPSNAFKFGSELNDLLPDGMKDGKKLSKLLKGAVEKLDGLSDNNDIVKAFEDANGKFSTGSVSLGVTDFVTCLIQLAFYRTKFEMRDERITAALKTYAKKSDLNVAGVVERYADNVAEENADWGAVKQFFAMNWDNIALGTISLGPGTLLILAWDAICLFTPLKGIITSAETLEVSKQATRMQDDSYVIINDEYRKAMSYKSVKKKYLTDMPSNCYSYFKFAMIARKSAFEYVDNLPNVDEATKTKLKEIFGNRNKELCSAINTIFELQQKTKNGADSDSLLYGYLLPYEMKSYNRNLDDSQRIDYICNKYGELIDTVQQEIPPVQLVNITEEEAIAMVKQCLDKYSMGIFSGYMHDMLNPFFENELGMSIDQMYEFRCIALTDVYVLDLYDDIYNDVLDGTIDELETDYCYIIAMYTNGTSDALFSVSADGSGVYPVTVDSDGSYSHVYQINFVHLDYLELIKITFDLFRLMGGIMSEELK